MWACISGNIKLVYYLLQQGADVNKVDVRGYNALHHAVQYNQTVIAHFLIGRGLFLDSRDGEGHTALMWAAYCNHEDTLRYLLQQGADVNSQDMTGCTSLHWAASKGNIKIVKILINEANADPTKKDKEGVTAAEVAQKKQFFNISKLLTGINYNPSNKNNVNSIEANLVFIYSFLHLISPKVQDPNHVVFHMVLGSTIWNDIVISDQISVTGNSNYNCMHVSCQIYCWTFLVRYEL